MPTIRKWRARTGTTHFWRNKRSWFACCSEFGARIPPGKHFSEIRCLSVYAMRSGVGHRIVLPGYSLGSVPKTMQTARAVARLFPLRKVTFVPCRTPLPNELDRVSNKVACHKGRGFL